MYPEPLLQVLQKLYTITDSQVKELEQEHQNRLQCRKGCHQCCQDDLEVFGIEAALIRKNHPEILQNEKPHPAGKCAFLNDEGACRIYESRPLICRTHGVPLRWLALEETETLEYRDICPLNEAGEPLEKLSPESCFFTSPFEEKLAELQVFADKGELHQESLRKMFTDQNPG